MNKNNNSDNCMKLRCLQKDKKSRCFSIISIFTISLILLLACSFSIDKSLAQTHPFIASSRGSFDLTNGNIIQQMDLPSALSILNSNNCPGSLAIYVHGVWASEEQAREQTERVALSLHNSGYNIPIIGFSWDSDTAFSLDNGSLSQEGWIIAKKIANENGPILAKFIVDFKDKCPNDKVRLIAHSLGSRVTLSAIQWIYDNDNVRNNNISKMISSVHLLGAAVNNEQISKSQADCRLDSPSLPCSGMAIEAEVGHFYNLYDPEDNMLASERILNPFCWICTDITIPSPYQYSENHDALGANGKESVLNIPYNYQEYNVLSKIIIDNDADKVNGCDILVNLKYFGSPVNDYYCTITKQGDNHMGYMGYRSSANSQTVYNSGAIGSIVMDWRNQPN